LEQGIIVTVKVVIRYYTYLTATNVKKINVVIVEEYLT